MRRLIAIFFILCATVTALADSLCDQSIDEGVKLYNKGKYEEALEYFEFASDRCHSSTAANWVSKCKTAIKNASSGGATKPSSTSVTPSYSAPTPINLSVSTQSISFYNYGGSASVRVSCNKEWGFTYLWKDASHQSVSYDFEVKRDGNILNIYCKSNPYSYTRSAQFDVFARENSKIRYTIYITQAAGQSYYISVTSSGTDFSSEGGVIKLNVQSNTDWEVESKSSWLGYRNKTRYSIEVYCNKNNSTSDLYGSIVLRTKQGGKKETVYFKQSRAWKAVSYGSNNVRKTSVSDGYMDWNGWYSVTWAQAAVSLGYPCNFDISAFDFRLAWFEFSLINFGWQSNTRRSNWYWQPNIRFYIPIDYDWAMTISAGPKLNFIEQDAYSYYDYNTGYLYKTDDYEQLTWLGMNKKWWFNAQIGFHWDWSDYFGSEFFIRYNGCVAIGATINVHTGF